MENAHDSHLVLERALEGGLGLVASALGDGAGRHITPAQWRRMR